MRAWTSWAGIALGAVALMVAAVHAAAGPFDREPPIEEVVAGQAKSVYETLRRQFAGDEEDAAPRQPEPEPVRRGIDRNLRAATAGCGALAVAFAFAGFARREDPRACGSAAVLGVAALPMELTIAVLLAALIVALAWRLLPGKPQARHSSERQPVPAPDRDQARL